ncbi:hypothetical protein Dsin_008799 [Dipteronia sinensis]|uniref:Uncharacterized protein n=1 Tax=Dipteronia sinensis TaxID=43782 RepID=A0AAE0AQI7_9ROSI|nr:hypothetical protein Dsin_008799 [Dipteronia sinensis]
MVQCSQMRAGIQSRFHLIQRQKRKREDAFKWFTTELLKLYSTLKETVESGIPRTSASNGLLESPDQEQQLIKKEQQTPSHSNIVIKDRDGTTDQNCDEDQIISPPESDQWVISIKEKLNQASQDDAAGTWGKLSIYKVPQHLRDGEYDHKAYVPQIVSLGPYHHGKKRLRQMDRHKWRSLHVVLKRTNQDIKVYIDSMREREEKARACYEGPIGLSSKEFVEMMVLDGCFVLELFRGAALGFKELGYLDNDPVFAMRGSMHSIQRDMMMLENQLPLFILDRLLGLQNPDQKGLVSELALGFFDSLIPTDEPLMKFDQKESEKSTLDHLDQEGLHCLDVFRKSLLRSGRQHQNKSDQERLHCLDVFRKSFWRSGPQDENKSENTTLDPLPDQEGLDQNKSENTTLAPLSDQEGLQCLDQNKSEKTTSDPLSDQGGLQCLDVYRKCLLRSGPEDPKQPSQANRAADKRRQQLIHCVTELREAGIKFKKRKTDRFWDIKFENGILWIPRLFIDDGTKSLFLNLIAFEQSHLDCSNDITSYVIFMDNLINTPEDVGYLHRRGIIEHWLGSDAEVADLFNRLCREVVFDINNSYLSRLSEDVNRYYSQRWNAWWASLRHNYFHNPWAIISIAAAVMLLLLTSAQTFYAVYGYYQPGS